jgi:hypothetical protein
VSVTNKEDSILYITILFRDMAKTENPEGLRSWFWGNGILDMGKRGE